FHVLRRSILNTPVQLALCSPQFDEICDIKKASTNGGAHNGKAQIAISRIEALQKDNLIYIEPFLINDDQVACTDPLIIKLLLAKISVPGKVCFVSDDKELRIRAREHLRQIAEYRYTIIEIDALLSNYTAVIETERLQIIPQIDNDESMTPACDQIVLSDTVLR
ncbi:MAG: hypothetical protein LBV12_12330, partial [Puniceicoccales bacterium]|nr:hypothetical protein [Puniceicoccales bacterium]